MSTKPQIEEVQYTYSRQQRGQAVTGRIKVDEVYQQSDGRWRVIGTDLDSGSVITLWPKDVKDRVRRTKK